MEKNVQKKRPIFGHETTALVQDKPPIPVNCTGKWVLVLCAPREGPHWPHYTSRYLKCLHMWTVMLFAAVELLSRPPKALGDLRFLLFSLPPPLCSRAPSLSPTSFSRDILSETARRPQWLSHVLPEERCRQGKTSWKEWNRVYFSSLCFVLLNTMEVNEAQWGDSGFHCNIHCNITYWMFLSLRQNEGRNHCYPSKKVFVAPSRWLLPMTTCFFFHPQEVSI